MPSITSADKGKTHSILACVSASRQVFPLFMIYPRKRPVPEKLREGAYPNTVFHVSDNGWIMKELFYEWFKMFAEMIPPLRPVLLVLDGHGSHITIDVIEYAWSKDIHLLCLPPYITALGCRGFQIVQILFLQGMPSVHLCLPCLFRAFYFLAIE